MDMDEAGDMGEEFDLVRVVQKVAKWLEKGLVVDAHVVACEDADKDAGQETDLCTVTEMAKVEAGPVERPLIWDDEDVAAPERFFCLYKNQMLISLMPASNLWGVIFLAVLCASCCQAIAAHIEHNQEHAKNKVDGKTLTVEKHLDLLLSSST